MIQTPKSSSSYQTDILSALAQSGIRQLAPGAKARAFADIIADKLGQLGAESFNNLNQVLLPFASGNSLDRIGGVYGINRIQQQNAYSDQSDSNFSFYVRTGTFGDINNGADIFIPSNTQIFTGDPGGPVYLSTNAITLLAGNSQQYFSATSLLPGSDGNAADGVFNRHSFSNYAQSAFGALLVTNTYGDLHIASGPSGPASARIHGPLASVPCQTPAEISFRLYVPGKKRVAGDESSKWSRAASPGERSEATGRDTTVSRVKREIGGSRGSASAISCFGSSGEFLVSVPQAG